MTEKPQNVRAAGPEDEEALFNLLTSNLYQENATFSFSPARVMATIQHATRGQGGIIGVIDGKNELAGTIGMNLGQFWYSEDWHIEEMWNYVNVDYRRTSYARDLIDFAKWCSERMNLVLNIGIISTHRTEAKVRLYRRRLTPCGEFFMHNLEVSKGPGISKISLGST